MNKTMQSLSQQVPNLQLSYSSFLSGVKPDIQPNDMQVRKGMKFPLPFPDLL